ncbi:hypothetical protein PPL_10693 [Heterostelium album PN500]|uniref:HAM1-like N-terminal domain-containing protein n=1 Tax=Heterostelium pallidum (strain ATCC 26659 / Pp 5 / PN500) TaxID=670386 RepID=D3BRT2_HETP5|nr:hypothetical protein PPL_10693 [Heterostelium album PN500]EFA76114.1 hypothetical protein PPL_10693 [Heterostelium album PN500]|eukprot:XP_020428248.1 hypothetical protein PPL_10693 [Heterostelium album PN500]
MKTKTTKLVLDERNIVENTRKTQYLGRDRAPGAPNDPYYYDQSKGLGYEETHRMSKHVDRTTIDPKKGGKDYYSRDEYLRDYNRDLNGRPYVGPMDRVSTTIKDPKARKNQKIEERRYMEEAAATNVNPLSQVAAHELEAPLLGPDGLPLNALSVNAPLNVQLKRHYNSIERLMETRIFREKTDERTKKIVYDIRNLVADLILMVESRGTDRQLMSIFEDMMLFRTDMVNDSEFKTLISNWQSTITKLATGDQSKGLLNVGKKLFGDIRHSDSILKLLSEGAKFLQMIILDRTNPLIPEQRELVFDLFFKAFGILSANPAWQQFVSQSRTFTTDIYDTQKYELKTAGPKLESIANNPNLSSAGNSFKELLQSLIRDRSVADIDKFIQYGRESIVEIQKNPQYENFFGDLRQIMLEIMENPSLMDDPATRKVLRDMYNRGETILTETRNNPSLQKFVSEGGRIKEGIATDELNARFYEHLKQFYSNFTTGPGKAPIDLKLLNQLKMLFVPFLLEEFRTITVPGQSGMTPDKKIGFRIGSINMSSIEMLPENIHFEISHKLNADPYTLSIIDPDTVVWVELTSIRCRIDRLPWAFEKYTFPKLKDAGHCDIRMDGRGCRVGVELRLLSSGHQRFTQILDSYCSIDKLNVRLYDCKHRIIYKLFNGIAQTQIRKAVEKAVAEKIAQLIAENDYKLMSKFQTAKYQASIKAQQLQSKVTNMKNNLKNKKMVAPKQTKLMESSFIKNLTGFGEQSSSGAASSSGATASSLAGARGSRILEQTTTTTTTTSSAPLVSGNIPGQTITSTAPVVTTSNVAPIQPTVTQSYVSQPQQPMTYVSQQQYETISQGTTLGQPLTQSIGSNIPQQATDVIQTYSTSSQPAPSQAIKTFSQTVEGKMVEDPSITPNYVGPSSN